MEKDSQNMRRNYRGSSDWYADTLTYWMNRNIIGRLISNILLIPVGVAVFLYNLGDNLRRYPIRDSLDNAN